MLLSQLVATIAALPLLITSPASPELAQAADPYADWQYLYEDSFENSAGQEITQQWWLDPDTTRQGMLLNFTLLAQRSPASDNGTAAALFDYVADCEGMMYAIERTEFLDSSDQTLDIQTYQRAMETADPDDEFYRVLAQLCQGLN